MAGVQPVLEVLGLPEALRGGRVVEPAIALVLEVGSQLKLRYT